MGLAQLEPGPRADPFIGKERILYLAEGAAALGGIGDEIGAIQIEQRDLVTRQKAVSRRQGEDKGLAAASCVFTSPRRPGLRVSPRSSWPMTSTSTIS
ncbi:hypothetical protein VSX56_20510 [Thioclava sp. CPCC 100088]|uniref:Uncharacterized protein n=1 Tax=Thioclava kandeliae TaxID=3070818 RepID=A0ABV1SMM6_9RHOB